MEHGASNNSLHGVCFQAASAGTREFVDKFQEADDVACTPPISVTAEVNMTQRGDDLIGDLPS